MEAHCGDDIRAITPSHPGAPAVSPLAAAADGEEATKLHLRMAGTEPPFFMPIVVGVSSGDKGTYGKHIDGRHDGQVTWAVGKTFAGVHLWCARTSDLATLETIPP